jgi:hypothetical protein
MKHMRILFIMACLILVTLTGCGAQPKATQESIAPAPATQTQKPSPLPPTATEPPAEVAAPSATPVPPTTTPKPTLAPEEAVTKLEDVLGTWQFAFEGDKYLIQFLKDGFWNLGWEGNLTALDRGKFTVEGNILHFLTSPRGCPDAGEATYEAYVIRVDGRSAKLHLVLVGEDNCANRNKSLNDKTLPIVNP